jgi:hypothetical protein
VRSTVPTSQLRASRRHEQIGDRLVYNAHRIEMRGDSMRKKRGKPNAALVYGSFVPQPGIYYDGRVLVGSRGRYQWVMSDQHFIGDIVRLCPAVLLGRYLAVTSTDSGEPKWWVEKLPGWECLGGVGYSPCLESTEGILYQIHGRENAGFDEWYTFETRADLGEVIVNENPWNEESRSRPGRIVALVNHFFSPDLPDDVRSSVFWDQLERIQPESYISDGAECVTFVSRNADLFQSVCALFALAMPTT